MAADGHLLGIDFGTSNTVAVVRWPDGRVRPLLIDGTPLLASAVFIDDSGRLVVGREALHAARARPESFEPNPKRRIDEGSVLLGGNEVAVPELIAAVLRRVIDEADRVLDRRAEVALTHPAAWGPRRRQILLDAAGRAGLAAPTVIQEPVAAASYFVEVHGSRVPVGSPCVVYDFGAGTFDASVVRRTASGFSVLACEGLPDAGGLDVDAAIFAYLGAVYAQRHPAEWARLEHPRTTADRRARRLLWEDVREAKEMLSRTGHTMITIPLLDEDAPLGREQIERLARPILDRTVGATLTAIRTAGIRPAEIAGLFLVGGSSRIPLVATLLHQALGVAPTVIEQPEMVVAEGGVCAVPSGGVTQLGAPIGESSFELPPFPVPPISAPPFPGPPISAPPFPGPPISAPPASPISASPISPISAPPISAPPAAPPPAARGVASVTASAPPNRLPPAAPVPAPPVHATPPPVDDAATPADADSSSASLPLRAIGAVAALVVAVLLTAAVDGAPDTFVIGLGAPFAYPAILLLPALPLVLVYGLVPGARAARAVGAVRHGALFVAGYAVGYGVGLVAYYVASSDGAEEEVLDVLAAMGGAVLMAAGILALIRSDRGPGARLRPVLPAVAGAAFALASLTAIEVVYEAFYAVFRSDETLSDGARYGAFVFGAAVIFFVAALVGALLPAARSNGSQPRWLGIATGLALLLGGVFTVYMSAMTYLPT